MRSMHVLLAPVRVNLAKSPSDDALSRILGNLSTTMSNEHQLQLTSSKSANHNPSKSISALPPSARAGCGALRTSHVVAGTDSTTVGRVQASAVPVGKAVRSTITVHGVSVVCAAVLGPFLCYGCSDGTLHVWDIAHDRLHAHISTGRNAILAVLGDYEAQTLVCGTSASSLLVYELSESGKPRPRYSVCCEGVGNVLSLVKVGKSVFAGFSDAGLRCVVRDIYVDPPKRAHLAAAGMCPGTSYDDFSKVSHSGSGYDFPEGSSCVVHMGFVFALAVCCDGKYLCSGSGDAMLRVWDIAEQQCVQKRGDHAGAILTLAVYEEGTETTLFSGSRDCSVKVWVWHAGKGFECVRTLRKHKDEVVFLAVSGRKLLSGSADGMVCVWCVETLALLCQYRDVSLSCGAVSSQYNSLFTASDTHSIQVRDIISMERDVMSRQKERRSSKVETFESNGRYQRYEQGYEQVTSHIASRQVAGQIGRRAEISKAKRRNGNSQDESCVDVERTCSAIVSEVDDDSDDAETFVPGVTNAIVFAPPNNPMKSLELVEVGCAEPNDTESMHCSASTLSNGTYTTANNVDPVVFERQLMQDVLQQFISFATVPNSKEHRVSCWQGARYIGRFLEGMGASVKYVNTSRSVSGEIRDEVPSQLSKNDAIALAKNSTSNPVVLARFSSADPAAKTITFYGHYDVMPAFDLSEWKTDPWEMKVVDGYLYGRGTTDNKGPIIAMVFAVKKLLEEPNGLAVNIVMVLQGEGEAANAGFRECIESHLHWFDRTCLVLTSNSTWLGENRPCLTYGFRGVIDLRVTVNGGTVNLHSGVDGGAVFEPMNDLIAILGSLIDSSGMVCVAEFYDDVRGMTAEELERLQKVEFDVDEYRKRVGVERFTSDSKQELLELRWRKPSISVASIETSNVSGFYSVVPCSACAKVSIRFVPEQDPGKLVRAITTHLEFEIRKRRSCNSLEVKCVNEGAWWLGDPSGEEFRIAAQAVRKVWGVEAELVSEGGSMPQLNLLSETIRAPLVQVPLGQASDGAHLPNERLRLENLYNGKEVLQEIVAQAGAEGSGRG